LKVAAHKTIFLMPENGETVYTQTMCAMAGDITKQVLRALLDTEEYYVNRLDLEHGTLVEYQFEFELKLGAGK
jgi:hypothetical protein